MTERPRAQPQAPPAGPSLSERGQELQQLVQEVLKEFEPEVGASLDIPEITVKPQHIHDVCRAVKDHPELSFKLLLCLAAVDYVEHLQLVYVLLSLEREHKLIVKANLPNDDPHLPTVTPVWRGADWYEREAHDLFGIAFDGHPDMRPLILYEGFEGYPGRKEHPFHDYQEY